METVIVENKLIQLFQKISEENYVLDNYYADRLLNQFKSIGSDISSSGKVLVLPRLVLTALPTIDSAHVTVKVFIIRLLAVICRNELHFTQIFAKGGGAITNEFLGMGNPETIPSTKVAYLELALALTTHKSGAMWLVQSEAWKHIYDLCSNNQMVFVLHQAYDCLPQLLWKLSDCEEECKLRNILDCIVAAIMQHPYNTVNLLSSKDEYELTKRFEPTIQILLRCMSDKTRVQKTNTLVKLLNLYYGLSCHLFTILTLTQRDDIMVAIAKLIFLLVLSKTFMLKPMGSIQYMEKDFLGVTVSYYNILHLFIKKRLHKQLIDFCNTSYIVWLHSWVDCREPGLGSESRVLDFQKKLLIPILVPLLVYITNERVYNKFDQSDPLNQYFSKLTIGSCVHSSRAAYSYRDFVVECGVAAIALRSVKKLSYIMDKLDNSSANILFQALYHILIKFVPNQDDIDGGTVIEESLEKVVVMTYVLDAVHTLVERHDINWHESLETLSLYNQVYFILKRKNLSCKFVVNALNLITVTIKKFLPPSLSLLMESKPGSPIHDLGKLINEKLHDPHWEIRDSALELLLVCTELSFIKYTPFQKQITDNNLMVVAMNTALNDDAVYVQEAAAKCVNAATKVKSVWSHLLSNVPNIQANILTLLYEHPEGIVRKEMVNVITEMYVNLKLTTAYKNTLYEHMVSTAINDFHWEVQIAALQFWRVVIKSLHADQGMLDGTFPSVTFSKDTRKIVTLNEHEIKKRLIKTLQDLANMGCLTVLVKLLDEDVDVEIMDDAYNVSLEFLNILNKYNVKTLPDLTSEQQMVLTDSISEVVPVDPNMDMYEAQDTAFAANKSDRVIDGILNTNDVDLISELCLEKMDVEEESIIESGPLGVKYQKHVSANLFLNVLNGKDFKSLIEGKRRWKEGIRSMSSLLDDVLDIYNCPNELNNLDCY